MSMSLIMTMSTNSSLNLKGPYYTCPCTTVIIADLLQHGPSKDRYHDHTQYTQSRLAHLWHNKTRGSTCASTCARATSPTAASTCTASSRASSSGRCTRCCGRVVAIAKDGSGSDTVLHETALQIGNRLLDGQAVVAAIAIEGFDWCGFAAVFKDGGCVAGEVRGCAADGASHVLCRELVISV